MTLLMLLAILLEFCLFYKIIVSSITKCVTETQIKLMMIRPLETTDQIYSSIRSITSSISEEGTTRRGNRFLDSNRLVRQVVQRLLVIVNRASSSNSTLSGLSTKSSPNLGMSIPSHMGQTGRNASQTLAEIKTEREGIVK